MSLDPHAKRFLDMLALAGPSAGSAENIEGRRQSLANLMLLSRTAVAIGSVEDRVIPGPDGVMRVRIYSPASAGPDALPGLIFFHGGGLVAGGLDTHDPLCRTLANEGGCRLVSVEYRLAPEHKFPAAVRDAYAAACWVAAHAPEFGILPGRVAISGDSAGGTLAAIVCQMAKKEGYPRLDFQLLLCPIMDVAAQTASRRAFARGHLLDQSMLENDVGLYLPEGVEARDPRVSPLRHTDFSSLPRAYIHTAEFDPMRDEGKAYADALTFAGVEVSYACHAGMIHLFYAMAAVIPYARTALLIIGAQIKAAFADGNGT